MLDVRAGLEHHVQVVGQVVRQHPGGDQDLTESSSTNFRHNKIVGAIRVLDMEDPAGQVHGRDAGEGGRDGGQAIAPLLL